MPLIRYPLVQAMMTRDGVSSAKDTYMQNGMAEKHGEKLYAAKRPGNALVQSFTSGVANQGLFYFNGFTYAVCNDTLFRTSGTANSGTDATAFSFAGNGGWQARIELSTFVFQDRIWVIDGFINSAGAVGSADVWSTQDGVTWAQQLAGAPFGARRGASVVVLGSTIYLIGGLSTISGQFLNDVWSSSDGVNWVQVTNSAPFAGRARFGCVVFNNSIIIAAGDVTGGGQTNDVWSSPDGMNWTQTTSNPAFSARSGCAMVVYKSVIYVIGGFGAGTAPHECYSSVDGIVWSQRTNSAFSGTGRQQPAVVVYNGKMILLGGYDGAAASANVYTSTDGATWTLIASAPGFTARYAHGAVVFKSPATISQYRYPSVWVFGGTTGAGLLNDVYYGNINTATTTSFALSPTTAGQPYQFETYMNGSRLLIKNQSNLWVLESGTLTKVTDPNYPPITVQGLVVLNLFAYVMTPTGELHACKIDDATTWPGIQFATADYEDDPGVAIAKYLNYIVVFGTVTTQFFYDNGAVQSEGFPAAPYQNANLRIGCSSANTVTHVGNTLCWLGQDEQGNVRAYTFDGMSPVPISDEWVAKWIFNNVASALYGLSISSPGHVFYILASAGGGEAMVYDMDTKLWSPWLRGDGVGFPYLFAASAGQQVSYMLGSVGGFNSLFQVDHRVFTDNGINFAFKIQTDKIDAGNNMRKFWGRVDIISDRAIVTATLGYTDDDYQTFSPPRSIAINQGRAGLSRWGSSRRRAWVYTQTDAVFMRLEALEITYENGES